MNKLNKVVCGLAIISSCFITAGAKTLEIYDENGQKQEKVENVNAISFADGKFTLHSADGIKDFDLDKATIQVTKDVSTGVTAVESNKAKVSIAGGVLTVVADNVINSIEVYTLEGIKIAAMNPAASTAMLNVNSASALLMVKMVINGETKIAKLVNK